MKDDDRRHTPEEQALIARAKDALMAREGMSEGQAHRWLQKQSMDHGARLADTARQVLDEKQTGKDA